MKLSKFRYILQRFTLLLLPAILLAIGANIPDEAMAYPASRYAQNSLLSSGKWTRIKVTDTGMQLITRAQLSAMGYADPSKVKVYGYGGQMISENLSADMPDDLPQIPSVLTSKGLLFFGVNNIKWSPATTASYQIWTHTMNPYSDVSYYFLSDSDVESAELPQTDGTVPEGFSGIVYDTFICRDLSEKDIFTPYKSGRRLFGEDFRSPNQRTFSFPLTDAAGDATVRVMFGSNTSSSSRLSISANAFMHLGPGSASLPAPTSSSNFMVNTALDAGFTDLSNTLDLKLTFSGGGTVTFARLDYIELEYVRRLRLNGGQLYFYDDVEQAGQYHIEGCNASTQIWNVTDPVHPVKVNFTLQGTTAVMLAPKGVNEYIAFNGEGGHTVAAAGSVSNQNIHALPTPDLVIFTPSEFKAAAEKIAEMRRRVDGYTVHVIEPQKIYNEFSSGVRDISAFRKALKMWYDRMQEEDSDRILHALIMGRPICDGKGVTDRAMALGYETIPIWATDAEASESTSYSTDDFIGMLDDGTTYFNISNAKIHAPIGRFPVTSAAEAMQAADKLIKYVETPDLGSWRNSVMIIADDQDNGVHLDQAEAVYKELTGNGSGRHYAYDRIYLDSYVLESSGTGPIYRQAKERMLRRIDEGVMYIDYIGHANPVSWGHENLLNWKDIEAFSNKRLPFLYGATCEFARWDEPSQSGAEHMWLNPNGGLIATISPSRAVYITNNGVLNRHTAKGTFLQRADGSPKTFGQIMIEGKNAMSNDNNKLRYCYLGDPTLRIFNPRKRVALTSLAGSDMTVSVPAADMPVIKARQQVDIEGEVQNPDGSLAADFNGKVHIRLLDAEKPITTNANGPKGEERIYNDRLTRLYTGITMVEGGKWKTRIYMPPEIENNYSTARLELYAYTEDGEEAMGSNENFYIYGAESTASTDTEGPEISLFTINHENFKEGQVVNDSPVAIAKFSDESGINISEAGVGHNLSLLLDGKKYFGDLSLYYTPDPHDATAGSIAYPLSGLDAGNHTLEFTVWDNANNSSTASVNFNISVSKRPEIASLSTNCNPAKTDVTFSIHTDMPMSVLECTLEVMDLQGRVVWSHSASHTTDINSQLNIYWNLCDKSGIRVPRGIYLYRTKLVTAQGTYTSKSSRLAVTAP